MIDFYRYFSTFIGALFDRLHNFVQASRGLPQFEGVSPQWGGYLPNSGDTH